MKRSELTKYLRSQGCELLSEVGMPRSTDPIESFFGLVKLHGVGEIKDADQIAIRLPALCGAPTREEARQVLGISVAEQHEIMDRFTSLTKQRREVLPNPDCLDSLEPKTGQRSKANLDALILR